MFFCIVNKVGEVAVVVVSVLEVFEGYDVLYKLFHSVIDQIISR